MHLPRLFRDRRYFLILDCGDIFASQPSGAAILRATFLNEGQFGIPLRAAHDANALFRPNLRFECDAAISSATASRRRPFFIHVDEFQDFTRLRLTNMMSELRKYRVGLIQAHQHLHQLDPGIRNAVPGNSGTLIYFRVEAKDGAFPAREFPSGFEVEDLLGLPDCRLHLKHMIQARRTGHSARTPCRCRAARLWRTQDLVELVNP